MKSFIRVAFAVAMGGCGPQVDSGNPALGIVRFEVDETPLRTVVRGLGAGGEEVGRLELVHGRFRLSGMFAEGYDDPDVDGRKLDVSVLGQQLQWETEGFEPTLHMPAHPAGHEALAAFLDDSHVAPLLGRWQIGFGAIETIGRSSQALSTSSNGYTCGGISFEGTHPRDQSGAEEGFTLAGRRYNMCGNGSAAGDAWTLHQTAAHWGYNQDMVTQCCPDRFGAPCTTDANCTAPFTCMAGICAARAFFAQKACPDTGTNTMSSCGKPAAGTCKACPGYPVPSNNQCSIRLTDAGWFDADAPGGGAEVSRLCYRFDWICGRGEGRGQCAARTVLKDYWVEALSTP